MERRKKEVRKDRRRKEGRKKRRKGTQLTGLSSCASVAVKEQLWVRLPDETG